MWWKRLVFVLLASSFVWSQASAPTATSPDTAASSAQSPSVNSTSAIEADSTKLIPIKTRKAIFPSEAGAKGMQGRVWLNVQVSEAGDVTNVEVISGDPIFTKAAIDAAKQWKFKPFIKNGKAIPVTAKLPFDFAFKDSVNDKIPPVRDGNPSGQNPVKLGEEAAKGFLIHRVQPVYPPDALERHIEGTVVLRAVIGTDGNIEQLTPISGPKAFIGAAMGAVQQWRYKPYMKDGAPVAVDTLIKVNFSFR